MKVFAVLALALLATPAVAQTEQSCLSKTITGKDIPQKMCFSHEALSGTSEGVCETVLIASGGTKCVYDRPAPPRSE